MRHVHGDEGNAGLEIFRRDRRRDGLIGLELHDQIDLLANQPIHVAKRDLRTAPVVEHDELDVLGSGRPHETGLHLPLKRTVVAERGVSHPKALRSLQVGQQPIPALVDFFNEVAVTQRVQQPEAEALAEPRALDDVAQAQRLAARLKRPEDFGGMDDRLNNVRLANGFGHERTARGRA